MNGGWTPGEWQALPWEAENGGTDWNVWGPKRTNHAGNDGLSGDYGSAQDAHLIAAAPELAETTALVASLPIADDLRNDVPVFGLDGAYITAGDVRKARAAISKARGEA